MSVTDEDRANVIRLYGSLGRLTTNEGIMAVAMYVGAVKAEAEAAGFRRGIEAAAECAEDHCDFDTADAILALLPAEPQP